MSDEGRAKDESVQPDASEVQPNYDPVEQVDEDTAAEPADADAEGESNPNVDR